MQIANNKPSFILLTLIIFPLTSILLLAEFHLKLERASSILTTRDLFVIMIQPVPHSVLLAICISYSCCYQTNNKTWNGTCRSKIQIVFNIHDFCNRITEYLIYFIFFVKPCRSSTCQINMVQSPSCILLNFYLLK